MARTNTNAGGSGGGIGGSILDGQIAYGSGTNTIMGDTGATRDPVTGFSKISASMVSAGVVTYNGTAQDGASEVSANPYATQTYPVGTVFTVTIVTATFQYLATSGLQRTGTDVFIVGATLTDTTSGATGTVQSDDGSNIILQTSTGVFSAGDTINLPVTGTVLLSRTGTAQSFDWTNSNGGSGTNVGITTATQPLNDGFGVQFNNDISGYTIGDSWSWTGTAYTTGWYDGDQAFNIPGLEIVGPYNAFIDPAAENFSISGSGQVGIFGAVTQSYLLTVANQGNNISVVTTVLQQDGTTSSNVVAGNGQAFALLQAAANGINLQFGDTTGTTTGYFGQGGNTTWANSSGGSTFWNDTNGNTYMYLNIATNPHWHVGDPGGGNGTTLDLNDSSGAITAVSNGAFTFQNVDGYRFIYAASGGLPDVSIGDIDNWDEGIFMTVSDTTDSYIFNRNNFNIGTIPYTFPFSQGSANTILTNDGSGNLSWTSAGAGAPIYPANQIVFGDGSTPGGVTSPEFTYDGQNFIVADSGSGQQIINAQWNSGNPLIQLGAVNGYGNFTTMVISDASQEIKFITNGNLKITDTSTNPFFYVDTTANRLVSMGDINNAFNKVVFTVDDVGQFIKAQAALATISLGDPANTGNKNEFQIDDSAGVIQAIASSQFLVKDVLGNQYIAVDVIAQSVSLAYPTLNINSVPYNWTAVQGGVSTVLKNDGAGNLSWITAAATNADTNVSVKAATTAALANTPSYSNGTGGVGATLTSSGNHAFPNQDGIVMNVGDRLLVWHQASQLQNGVYELAQKGSGTQPWILTRTTDADNTQQLNELVVVPTQGTQKDMAFGQMTLNPTIGTSNIVFATVTNTNVTQATTGTQVLGQIPTWNSTARQLTRGTSNFTWNGSTFYVGTSSSFINLQSGPGNLIARAQTYEFNDQNGNEVMQFGNSGSIYAIIGDVINSGNGTKIEVLDSASLISLQGNIGLNTVITPTGTTGAVTINTTSGRVNFGAGDGSLVVTNSLVTANSKIFVQTRGNDATMTYAWVDTVVSAGSFTIYPNNNPIAETSVDFVVLN